MKTPNQNETDKIRVRAYRHGLGDCFLLSFLRSNKEIHVLIDCGVLTGTTGSKKMMADVVSDIGRVTGKRLDVVIATHEHWDHLSGFIDAETEFNKITIGDVWLAWTEDPTDALAGTIRSARDEAFEALTLAINTLHLSASEGTLKGLKGVTAFFGVEEPSAPTGDNPPAPTSDGTRLRKTEKALSLLKSKATQKVRYLKPGDSPTINTLSGVKFYVLGPPRDLESLKRSRIRRGEGYDEKDLNFATSFLAAVKNVKKSDSTGLEDSCRPFTVDPYTSNHLAEDGSIITEEAARTDKFFKEQYYEAKVPDGFDRKIDNDWLGTAHDIALKLDAHTNNTSLVLAIELQNVEGNPVLLFPADAQAGNWLSWGKVSFSNTHNGRKQVMKGHDLLRRTVLYKVGHHGSHNATLSENGLDLMGDNLTAVIPVDLAMAKDKEWQMPFGPLYERLLEKCKRRVITTDKNFELEEENDAVSTAEWESYKEQVKVEKLYIDYIIDF